MNDYILLLRGVNVGGKSKLSMSALKEYLTAQDFKNVTTYINSGNILLSSKLKSSELSLIIENILVEKFNLNTSLTKVLVLTKSYLEEVIKNKPKGFGEDSDKFKSDVVFLIGINAEEAIKVFSPKEGVDKVWTGEGVIYFERLSEMRTKSRLSKIISTPEYKSMTIRNWNTTTKLLELARVRLRE